MTENNLFDHLNLNTNALDNRLGSVKLTDGSELIFYPTEKAQSSIIEGCGVKINEQEANDGLYKSTTGKRFEIVNGFLHKEFSIENYKQTNGISIEVDCYRMQDSRKGSSVWLNDKPAPDGQYRTGIFSTIHVKNGVVV